MKKNFCSLIVVLAISLFSKNIFAQNSQTGNSQTAILAGGCFWGMEELLRKLDGVESTRVGYIGGTIPNPTYELVSTGLTNYAESVKITFNPNKISYEKLLKFFFTIHDPTTLNRQENDAGTQYRSAIFYLDEQQKLIAQKVIKDATQAHVFKRPITTSLEKAGKFYAAEDVHQNYLQKNPYGYTCHHVHDEWKF